MCTIPAYSDPGRVNVNLTDEETEQLMVEGRCFLACTTEELDQTEVTMYTLHTVMIIY